MVTRTTRRCSYCVSCERFRGPYPVRQGGAAPPLRALELQPAHVLGGTDRRHTVVRADLADGVGQVVADGALGQVEQTRDLGDTGAVGGGTKDLGLTVGEGTFTTDHGGGGKIGVDVAATLVDAADRAGELFQRNEKAAMDRYQHLLKLRAMYSE